MTRLLACLLVLAGLFPMARATAQQLQPLDGIVAVVDEGVILQSELDRALRNIHGQYAGRENQLPPPDILSKQVLERLVLIQLQVARAESSGIRVSDQELDRAINSIAQQNNTDIQGLSALIARDGLTLDDLRQSVRDEIMVQRLRQSFAQGRVSVSESEVDAALATEAGGSQFRLAHILVALPEGATPEQIARAQEKINKIGTELQQGAIDFAAAAVRYSDSPNALEGGDLGWRTIDEIPPSFSQAITQMQPGQIIGPIRGPSGFQLLQLVEKRDAAADTGSITQLRARHILVTGDDAAAVAQLETLRARIAGGADFAELAREFSQDPATSEKGGELGWFARDAFGVDFGQQVTALQQGEVSAPFKTQAGWHIVQLEGTRQVAGDDNRRQQVRESIGQRKLEEQWERFLRELRGEAYVDIRIDEPATAPAATPDAG